MRRLLDLFCGAGGAAMGYARAGFTEIVGVDNRPQKNYPFTFVLGDALEYLADCGKDFDVIHASPPCQAFSSMRTMPDARVHANWIPATRAALRRHGAVYVIENVIGAPLEAPAVMLCGTMFDLGCADAELRRHRVFETSQVLLAPPCRHGQRRDRIGVYGGHLRNRRRTIGLYGEGARDSVRKINRGVADFSVTQGREAMGIDWMTLAELCEAIPPAYTEFIGRQLLATPLTRLEWLY